MTDVAAADGLDFRFDRIRPGNTFDAHRVLHLAKGRGVQDKVIERLFRAQGSAGVCLVSGGGGQALIERLSVPWKRLKSRQNWL